MEWSKRNDQLFHPLTEEVQTKATDVLRDFPTMIKMKSTGNSNADPFLIATAVLEGATIVSDEHVTEGGLVLKEHEAARWLKNNELDSVKWLPADQTIIELLEQLISEGND